MKLSFYWNQNEQGDRVLNCRVCRKSDLAVITRHKWKNASAQRHLKMIQQAIEPHASSPEHQQNWAMRKLSGDDE